MFEQIGCYVEKYNTNFNFKNDINLYSLFIFLVSVLFITCELWQMEKNNIQVGAYTVFYMNRTAQ